MSLYRIGVAVDQLANALLGGFEDEMLSARAFRLQHSCKRWMWMRRFIDAVFFWETRHCWHSYQTEKLRKQSPGDYR